MQPIWLIEAGVYKSEINPLLKELRRQGLVVGMVRHQALKRGEELAIDGHLLADGDCVIGYGTFPFARQIQLHRRWTPGAWCNAANLDCACYYAYFGKFLLNQHYAIMPGIEAIRQQDWLFQTLGKDCEIFARPTSCTKLFTGRCIYKDDFAAALSLTRHDRETLVVVAPPREIEREWRLVVADDRVIAASQYFVQGSKSIAEGCPAEVKQFAEAMLAEVRWRPDPVFMLDVCEADGKLWLVEINSFSSSWLYDCNVEAVVTETTRIAAEAWEKTASIAT